MDESTTSNVHGRVTAGIHEFIAEYSSKQPGQYNRFIITSRIADSEPGAFAQYPHYTLLDLDEQQIDQFLKNWCLAIARYQAVAHKGTQPLIEGEEADVRVLGTNQYRQLLHILKNNPDLMSVAASPIALAIIVLLHASGRDLRQHRIQLYQMITSTLLNTWNRESGRKVFSSEEIPLAEQLLSSLAYRLQESDALLTADDVAMITRQTLAKFHQRPQGEIRESEITQFIEILRRSSGLFVEGGEDLFYFANRTIQDYYVTQYLLHMPQEELKQLAFQHSHSATWHELLLLALTWKSRQILLTTARSRRRDEPAPTHGLPTQPLIQTETWAENLQALQEKRRFTRQQVEELLVACTGTRSLPVDTQRELGVGTVQEMAWKLIRQSPDLEDEALDAVLKALDSSKAPICEGAAMLLMYSKSLPHAVQQKAAQKIWHMLIDKNIYDRFASSGSVELQRLYDTLVDTLKAITDRSWQASPVDAR